MNLSKEKKYKYKFFKAVLDKNYSNLDTYSQKYLEYCSDTDVKNMFNKNNKLYGGSLNDEHKYNLFKAILDKNYKKLPKYALKYAKHTKDRDVKNMFGGDVRSIIDEIKTNINKINSLEETKKIIEFYITDLNNIFTDIGLLYNELVNDTDIKDNKIKLYNNYFNKINDFVNNLEYNNLKLNAYTPNNDITKLLTELNDKILSIYRQLLNDDTAIKDSYNDNTVDNNAFKANTDTLVTNRYDQYNIDYTALITGLTDMIPTEITDVVTEMDTRVTGLVQIEQELAAKVGELKTANDEKADAVNNLNLKVGELKTANDEKADAVNNLNLKVGELKTANDEKAAAEKELTAEKKEVIKLNAENASLKLGKPSAATDYAKLAGEIAIKDIEINNLKNELAKASSVRGLASTPSVSPKPQVFAVLSGHDNPHNFYNKFEHKYTKNKEKYSNIVIE